VETGQEGQSFLRGNVELVKKGLQGRGDGARVAKDDGDCDYIPWSMVCELGGIGCMLSHFGGVGGVERCITRGAEFNEQNSSGVVWRVGGQGVLGCGCGYVWEDENVRAGGRGNVWEPEWGVVEGVLHRLSVKVDWAIALGAFAECFGDGPHEFAVAGTDHAVDDGVAAAAEDMSLGFWYRAVV